jgi:hypothetical protein
MTRFTRTARRATSRLSSAHVLALMALVVACSGTAYAAATIGSAQIVNDSVRSIDVKNNNLTGTDIKNGTLSTLDLSSTAQQSLQTTFRADGTMVELAGGAAGTATFNCDYTHGERATGGGGASYYANKGYLTKSTLVYGAVDTAYEGQPIGWTVSMQNLQGTTNYLVLRVICAKG